MLFLRAFCALFLACFLAVPAVPPNSPGTPALGILTQAYQAHVDAALAFAGLSVFDGEQLSTDQLGHLSVRVGNAVLTLAGQTSATVFRTSDGIHLDLACGSIYFNGPEGESAEVHVSEALLRTAGKHTGRVLVTMLGPKVLQVAARVGGVNFSYRGEYRFLPEGQTYRIYLDAPAEPQVDNVGSTSSGGITGKVAYFIVGGASAGIAAWGVHHLDSGGNPPISPSTP